ncbi:hypothetical protein NDU88_005457 [Pleurodeles waltl]|uniref:Secreted protein n=1 Tax=Pleurodeles waltl TaxID=8319 RepID=A0AAV7WYL2_PLEWA|nr:hypothetical protein NDU88_005457 [Pleurodeles waltl]
MAVWWLAARASSVDFLQGRIGGQVRAASPAGIVVGKAAVCVLGLETGPRPGGGWCLPRKMVFRCPAVGGG